MNNNDTSFERKPLEMALVVLYVSVDIKPFIGKSEVKVRYLNQSKSICI